MHHRQQYFHCRLHFAKLHCKSVKKVAGLKGRTKKLGYFDIFVDFFASENPTMINLAT